MKITRQAVRGWNGKYGWTVQTDRGYFSYQSLWRTLWEAWKAR